MSEYAVVEPGRRGDFIRSKHDEAKKRLKEARARAADLSDELEGAKRDIRRLEQAAELLRPYVNALDLLETPDGRGP